MKERDRIIVKKIIKYCAEVDESHMFFHTDKDLFVDKEKGFIYRNAITMPILQIGEIANNLTEEFMKEYKKLPWKDIIGTRHIYAHHYGDIDFDMVWTTSIEDIPFLKDTLTEILNDEDGGQSQ